MLHDKYHSRNHYTTRALTCVEPDEGHDPIASKDQPFRGDFVLSGGYYSQTEQYNHYAANISSIDTIGVYASGTQYSFESVGNVTFHNNLEVTGLTLTNTVIKVDLNNINTTNTMLYIDNGKHQTGIRLWRIAEGVPIPPTFVLQPSLSQLDFLNTSTSILSSSAVGSDPITYQWYRNGEALTGATNKILQITQDGVYYVIATNSIAHAMSHRVTVTPKPIANTDIIVVLPYTEAVIDVLSNDKTYGSFTISSYTQPSQNGGVLNFDDAANIFIYEPNTFYKGYDSFTYTITDFLNRSSTNTVIMSCEVIPPSAVDDIISVALRDVTTFNIGANDKHGTLTSKIISNTDTKNGKIIVNKTTGFATYYPSKTFKTLDSFVYKIQDRAGNESTAKVTLSAHYTPLSALDDTFVVDIFHPTTFSIFKNDIKGSFNYGLKAYTLPTYGTLVLNQNTGIAEYTPNELYKGLDMFQYTIIDETGTVSTATVRLSTPLPTDWQFGELTCPGETPVNWSMLEQSRFNTLWIEASCQAIANVLEVSSGTPVTLEDREYIVLSGGK